jgi:hypothetical protein
MRQALLSVRGEQENYHGNDDTENPKKSIDVPMKWSGVWIGFGRHGEKIRN